MSKLTTSRVYIISGYRIVFEKTSVGYSSYSPDLSGCVSAGGNLLDCLHHMIDAISLHLEDK